MTTAERITEVLNSLPPSSQREALEFIESLAKDHRNGTSDDRISLMAEAMSDPLFVADLEEISEDFSHVDLEEVTA